MVGEVRESGGGQLCVLATYALDNLARHMVTTTYCIEVPDSSVNGRLRILINVAISCSTKIRLAD